MANTNLKVKITAVDKTQKAFRAVAAGLKAVSRSLFSFKTSILAAVGVGGLGLLIKTSLDSIDKISKMSRTLGIAVPDLRKLEHAAELSGIQLDTVARAVRTLNKGAVDFVREGAGEAADAFDALGITATDLDGVLGDQFATLTLIADRFENVKNAAERSSIAQQLFGGRASDLLLVLEEGGEGLRRLGEEAEDFGLILSTATAQNVEEANDAFTRLISIFKGVRDSLVGALAPAFQKLADTIRDRILQSVKEAGGIREFAKVLALDTIGIFERIAEGLNRFVQASSRGVNFLISVARALGRVMDDEFLKQIEKLDENYRLVNTDVFVDLRDEINAASASSKILGDTLTDTVEAIEAVEASSDKMLMTMKDAKLSGVNALEDALVSLADRTSTVQDAFKSMARSIISDLIRIGIQQQITGPLAQMMGLQVSTPTGKAIGGPVQAGRPYMVGERGPEMFVPNQSGSIVPNGQMASGGVNIVQNINITTGVQQTVRAEVMQMLPQISNAAKGAVLDARRRGGSFAAAF